MSTTDVWWIVVAPLNKFLVEAGCFEDARRAALEHVKLEHKPWLAANWDIRVATEAEKHEYAAHAEGYRKSEPTLKTAKRKTKTPTQRLFGG